MRQRLRHRLRRITALCSSCRATPQRPARPQLLFCLVRSSALSAQGASLLVVGCDTAGNNKRGVVFVFARGTASATIGGGAAQERWWQTQALRIDDGGVSSIGDGYDQRRQCTVIAGCVL